MNIEYIRDGGIDMSSGYLTGLLRPGCRLMLLGQCKVGDGLEPGGWKRPRDINSGWMMVLPLDEVPQLV